MGKTLKFNGTVVTQSHRVRVRGVTTSIYPNSQLSINRGVQARRQKRLKVSLATVKSLEDADVE